MVRGTEGSALTLGHLLSRSPSHMFASRFARLVGHSVPHSLREGSVVRPRTVHRDPARATALPWRGSHPVLDAGRAQILLEQRRELPAADVPEAELVGPGDDAPVLGDDTGIEFSSED